MRSQMSIKIHSAADVDHFVSQIVDCLSNLSIDWNKRVDSVLYLSLHLFWLTHLKYINVYLYKYIDQKYTLFNDQLSRRVRRQFSWPKKFK